MNIPTKNIVPGTGNRAIRDDFKLMPKDQFYPQIEFSQNDLFQRDFYDKINIEIGEVNEIISLKFLIDL